jgi:GntR family transcriptional regulator of vanillate catabolism
MDPIEPSPAASPSLVASLRKLIGDGHYPAGSRLAEESVAQALGVSRTPVRLAFRTLAQEGLLQPAGKRGFVVREFSGEDVLCAVEVRGVLEGLAARRLAERGLDEPLRAALAACIDDGEALLAKGHLVEADIERWSALNARFHQAIVHATASRVIADAIARNNHLPFASADSIAMNKSALPREYEKLRFAQMQHRLVFDALVRGEGARAEALMREHANIGVRYGTLFGLDDGFGAEAAA